MTVDYCIEIILFICSLHYFLLPVFQAWSSGSRVMHKDFLHQVLVLVFFIWTPARSFSSCTFKTIIVSLKMVSFVLPQKRVIHRTRSFRQWSVWLCIMTVPKVCFIKIKHFCWVNSIWDRCINGGAYTSWILLSCSYLLCTWDTNFYRLLLFQLFQFFT